MITALAGAVQGLFGYNPGTKKESPQTTSNIQMSIHRIIMGISLIFKQVKWNSLTDILIQH